LKLPANWRAVMAHAWSVWLMLLAALLFGLEVALRLMHGFPPPPQSRRVRPAVILRDGRDLHRALSCPEQFECSEL
jgi:hypothetical protein